MLALILLVFVSGCFYDPAMNVGVFSARDTISADDTPGLTQGPVERSVVLHVPAGALERAEQAVFRIEAITGSSLPFSDIELAVGNPVNETLLVDSLDQFAEEFDMAVPASCAEGCDFIIPVTITRVGSDDIPFVRWSVTIFFDYQGPGDPPEAADDMTAEIVPAGG